MEFLLTVGASLVTVGFFYLQLKLSHLQLESGSNKHLNGLYAKKLNCKQKTPTVRKKLS